MSTSLPRLILAIIALSTGATGLTQDRLEQANPDRVEDNRPTAPNDAIQVPPVTASDLPNITAAAALPAPIRLSGIEVAGLQDATADSLRSTLAPFVDRSLDRAELKNLVNAIVGELRRRGYVFASASIPPQSVDNGRLTVLVDEGSVDEVVIEGSERPFTRSILQRLANGRPVTQARLERQILLANDGTGTFVGRSSYAVENGRSVLRLRVSQDSVGANVSLDNWGSRFVGPVRARVAVRLGGVFDGADALALSLSTVPASPREYKYGRVGYVRRLDTNGTEASVSVSAGETHLGSTLRSRDIAGASRSASVGLSHPLVRGRDASLWGDLGLTVRSSSQDRFGRPARDDRFTNLTADLYGTMALGDARARGRVTATRGLGVFGATRQGDPLASRDDGDARFTSVFAAASVTVPVVARVSARLAGEGQVASRPLLSSEEFGIGGSEIGRGYDYSERLGDQGVAGVASLTYALPDPVGWTDELRLSAFLDGGVTRDIGTRRFDGSLASAGLGAAVDLSKGFAAELTLGVPLTGPREASGDRSPRIGFTLAKRF